MTLQLVPLPSWWATSHPLYYLLAAGWQDLLRIPAFTPVVVPEHYKDPWIFNRLPYSHNYTPTEHQDALYLKELRLLSVLLGLGTVLLTYAVAKVAGMSEPISLSAGLFVACLPRELTISTAVTNDALVGPLCALALLLFLLAERARSANQWRRRRFHLFGMGLVLGAAAATKFSSLPIAAVLLLLTLVPVMKFRRRLFNPSVAGRVGRAPTSHSASDSVESDQTLFVEQKDVRLPVVQLFARPIVDLTIGIVGFLAVSGWWFVRNDHLYGQFLATKASESYLNQYFLVPVPWTTHLLFSQLPQSMIDSTWYTQPDFLLPAWMNWALSGLGAICIAAGAWVLLMDRSRVSSRLSLLSSLAVLGCIVAGVVAVTVIIKTTGQGHGRVALVAVSAFAVVAVVGSEQLFCRMSSALRHVGLFLWPIALIAVDLYVIIRFLIPLGGL
jgi:hypothetical protein